MKTLNATVLFALVTAMFTRNVLATEVSTNTQTENTPNAIGITPSLGIAHYNHNVVSKVDVHGISAAINQTSTIGKLNYDHNFIDSSWAVGAGLSSTLSSISNDYSATDSVQFISADLYVDYLLSKSNDWSFKLGSGAAFRTMNNSFAYANWYSNQLEARFQLTMTKAFSKGVEASLYGRFNPMIDTAAGETGIKNLGANNEIAIGASYDFAKNSHGQNLMINGEFSSLNLRSFGDFFAIANNVMMLSLGYRL